MSCTSKRLLGLLLPAIAAAGCVAPVSPATTLGRARPPAFALEVLTVPGGTLSGADGPDGADAPVGAAPLAPSPSVAPPIPATPAPTDAPPSRGNGSGGGGRGGSAGPLPPPPELGFQLPDGRTVPAVDADEVPIPPGAAGQITLYVPGRVVSTLEIPRGATPPPATHPRRVEQDGPAPQAAVAAGGVTPVAAGLLAAFVAPGRPRQATAQTGGDGRFVLTEAVAGPTDGLVVVREAGDAPAIGVARATIAPTAPIDVGSLALLAPEAASVAAPAPPSGLRHEASHVQLELAGLGRATILSTRAAEVRPYAFPGFPCVVAFEAVSDDGTRSAFTGATAPASPPPFLRPPDVAHLGDAVAPGARLSWPSVPGATLYTLRLHAANQPTHPLWEAAVTTPRVVVPQSLVLAGELVLRVEAWDAPSATPYSLAGLRALRLPVENEGTVGRYSATVVGLSLP